MSKEKRFLITDQNNQYNVLFKKKLRKKALDQNQQKSSKEANSKEENLENLIVSSSPHVFSNTTTTKIMRDVIIALIPASIAAVVLFGLKALMLILVCIATSVFCEWGFQKICKQKTTIGDLSAIVTGLLLALNLPASVLWWQAVIGSIVAIVVVKGIFGGIGKNFANPAITARIVMLLAFGTTVGASVFPRFVDATTSATPLAILKMDYGFLPEIWQMLVGMRGGAIGETCAIALIIGGIYLLVRKVITWHTPVIYILGVFIFSLLFKGFDVEFAIYQVLSGGLLIGAIFMATDYTTSPSRPIGKIIFAIGCAFITVVIRLWGNYPEGVSFSILFMNILNPFIDRIKIKKPLGGVKA